MSPRLQVVVPLKEFYESPPTYATFCKTRVLIKLNLNRVEIDQSHRPLAVDFTLL